MSKSLKETYAAGLNKEYISNSGRYIVMPYKLELIAGWWHYKSLILKGREDYMNPDSLYHGVKQFFREYKLCESLDKIV